MGLHSRLKTLWRRYLVEIKFIDTKTGTVIPRDKVEFCIKGICLNGEIPLRRTVRRSGGNNTVGFPDEWSPIKECEEVDIRQIQIENTDEKVILITKPLKEMEQ